MKQQVVFEMNIPSAARPIPSIRTDGCYELLWELPNGSYVRLVFESADTIHETYGRLGSIEMARQQEREAADVAPEK